MTTVAAPDRPRGMTARLAEFFYSEETPYGVALVRMFLPLVLLIEVLPRWAHSRELFSSQGAPTPLWVSYGIEQGLPIPSAALAVALMSLLVVLLLTASVGWFSRFSIATAALIYAYVGILDATSTLDKCVCICTHAMLLLGMSQCGAVWSVDAWLRSARFGTPRDAAPPRFPAWPRRLLQLLIGIVYLASAVTKVHTPLFFSGDHLVFWMLTDITPENPLGDFLSMYPAFVPTAAYTTFLWEVTFVLTSWKGYGRLGMLGIGVVFHALTWSLLGLLVFPLVYLCLYMAWVNERDVERFSLLFGRLRARLSPALAMLGAAVSPIRRTAAHAGVVHSAMAFSLVLAATALAGIELERRNDTYNEFGPSGRAALRPVPAERVARLFSENARLLSRDKVFSFDVGSMKIGDLVADRRRAFDYGEKTIVQCSLAPPHEDLWVEFNLMDADGRIVSRHGQIVPREQLRSTHEMELGEDLRPGQYAWLLRLDGHDVARRDFTLGAVRTASAEE